MEDAVIENIEELEEKDSMLHIESQECNCFNCQSRKKQYIQILDMERYVEHLNDWD